jgi:hypothetical protein
MITEQKEIKLWHWLKLKLSKAEVDMQRIENTTGCGVPDVNACYKGLDAWIELKVYIQGCVVLRKEQYAWLSKRAAHDGNVMVIAHNPDAGHDSEIEIYTAPFTGRPWGNQGKYVALTSEPEYMFSKNDLIERYLKAIFGE